jgi:hypothetical protein
MASVCDLSFEADQLERRLVPRRRVNVNSPNGARYLYTQPDEQGLR